MSERNIKSFEEYLRRTYKRTTKHFLEDNMDLDNALSAAMSETSDEVILDIQKDFMNEVLKMIFKK